jgi:photosystem II stability/assembly factor-like uncharacterized protein
MNLRRAVAWGICIGVACGPRSFDEKPREYDDEAARRAWEAARSGPIAPDYLTEKRAFLEQALRDSTRRLAVQAGQVVQWKNIGPFEDNPHVPWDPARIDSGRLRVIVTHPTDPKIIYVGAAGGGVWKTTNADLTPGSVWTWTALTDGIAPASASGNIQVGSLAMSPADPETLYLGLGDPFQLGGARGFFITHDGGGTWTAGGDLGATSFIYAILAIGPSVVLVGGSDGLWRSTDGGRSFSRVVFPARAQSQEFVYSIARYADGTLLCTRSYLNGIERSTDDGATWTLAPLPPDPPLNRMTLAISGSTAWALAADFSGRLLSGLFKSTDHGVSWVWVPSGTTQFPWVQGEYNQMLAVDPDAPSHIFAGGFYPLRSMDGGMTWEPLGSAAPMMHPDLHTAAWSRAGKKALFIGHDGGLSVLSDPWATLGQGLIDSSHNRGLVTDLVYQVSGTMAPAPPDARDRVAIGLQDNGCLERRGTPLGQSGKFDEVEGGDGFYVLYHPMDGRLLLCGMNGVIAPIKDGALNGTEFRGAQGMSPLFPDPSDPSGNSVYTLSYDGVIKSTDFGQSWTTLPRNGIPAGVLIFSLVASPVPGGPLLITTDQSGYRSIDGGQNWSAFPNPQGANGLAFGGRTLYAWITQTQTQNRHVWRSLDLGDTWTPIDRNGLPPLPVWQIVPDPKDSSVLWAATDVGVYRSADGGGSWSRFGAGLPWIAVRSLYVAADGSVLRAGTYGRGVWEAELPKPGLNLQISPARQTAAAGSTVTYAIAADVTGTIAPIVLGVSGLPAGAGASFSSSSPPSVLTITIAAGAAPGTATFTVTGVAGEARASAAGQLSVIAPGGLAIAFVPPSVQLAAGGMVKATVRASFDGAPERIALQTGSLPAGITATLEPSELPGPGDAVLTLRAAPDAAASQSAVVVSGSTASASASADLSLVIAAAGAPSVAIVSPLDGEAGAGPWEVRVDAQVAQGLTLRELTLLADGTPLGTFSSSPFAFNWDAPPGPHELTARVVDSAGQAATSLPVHVTRTSPPLAPTTAVAPLHGGCHSADSPDLLSLLAAATALRLRKRRSVMARARARRAAALPRIDVYY